MTTKNNSLANNAPELQRKIASGSQNPSDYSDLANLEFEAGRYDEAVSLRQRALTLTLTNVQRGRMHWELAWLYEALERTQEALEQAEKTKEVLATERKSPAVLFLLATAESLSAQCSEDPDTSNTRGRSALRGLNQLIAEAPDFENIAFAYGQVAQLHNLLGEPEEAARLCEQVLQKDLDPRERLDCLLVFSEALRLTERFGEAENALVEALTWAESDRGRLPRLYFSLGLIRNSLNRSEGAQEAFRKALTEIESQPFLPDNPTLIKEIYWNLGQMFSELEDYKSAVITFQKLLPLYPEDDLYRRDVLVSLGESHHEAGNLPEARNCYEQVLNSPHASENEKASTQQGIGKIYYDLEEYDEAIAAFQAVVDHITWELPFYGDTLLWLGNCYYAKGDYKSASDCYRKVLLSTSASERDRTAAQDYITQLPKPFRVTLQ
jgi:tetratricopeptide (TPR) repeat protein